MGVEMEDVERAVQRRRARRRSGTVTDMVAAERDRHGAGRGRRADRGARSARRRPRPRRSGRSPASSRSDVEAELEPDSAAALPWSEWSARADQRRARRRRRAGRRNGGRSAAPISRDARACGAASRRSSPAPAGRSSWPGRACRPSSRRCRSRRRSPAAWNPGPHRQTFDRRATPAADRRADARPGFREFVVLIAGADGAERARHRRDAAGACRRSARRWASPTTISASWSITFYLLGFGVDAARLRAARRPVRAQAAADRLHGLLCLASRALCGAGGELGPAARRAASRRAWRRRRRGCWSSRSSATASRARRWRRSCRWP